jgi:glucose-1-phosphate adenylyltransferase
VKRPRTLAFVLAGGRGERLFPLTRDRSKPAIPFAGKYRIVDFVLSNLVNSGFYAVYVLVQYKAQSLIEHIRLGWQETGLLPEHFVAVVPPQMRFVSDVWYRGTADAVAQNLNLIEDFDPDLVAIFGADHVYRMDVSQMLAFHGEREAQVTVAAIPVPVGHARSFGIMETDGRGRVLGFEEKPERAKPMPSDPGRALASMGNYLFDRRLLEAVLVEDLRRSTEHDFGRTILPDLIERGRVFAYDFLQNAVPGTLPHEEPGYWRDVGTIEAYYEAHMDLLGSTPKFELSNRRWPLRGVPAGEGPARIEGGEVRDALLGEGTVIRGARIVHSILGRGVELAPGSVVEDSIVMSFTKIGEKAVLRRAIVDRHNVIPPGESVGVDPDRDRRHGHVVDPNGLVVVARGTPPPE